MAKPKVLISDELSPRAVEILSERGCDVDFKPGLKPAELRAIIGNYEGLAIRSATKVTAEVLAEAKKLGNYSRLRQNRATFGGMRNTGWQRNGWHDCGISRTADFPNTDNVDRSRHHGIHSGNID